jgi:hypothetical protein
LSFIGVYRGLHIFICIFLYIFIFLYGGVKEYIGYIWERDGEGWGGWGGKIPTFP